MRGRLTRLVVVVSSPYYICGILMLLRVDGMLIWGFCDVIETSVDPLGQKFLDFAPDLVKAGMNSRAC